MRFRVLLPFLLFASTAGADVVVDRNSNLRADPSSANPPIRLLTPPARLDLLDATPQNNYLNVRTQDDGTAGWVFKPNVTVEPGTLVAGSFEDRRNEANSRSDGVCADNLEECPPFGCAQPGTPHALVNEQKRTVPPVVTLVRLSFMHFVALQAAADDLGIEQGRGSHLTAAMRAKLRDLDLGNGIVAGEGSLVQLVGFIAPERDLRASGPESVNCRLTRTAENDIHLPIVDEADETEYHAIVVEPIPQGRPAAWSVPKFKQLQRDGKLLMFRGQLFYDNQHKVRDDPEHEEGLSREPKRFTLWEVHPITEIKVCKNASNDCDAGDETQWDPVL